MFRDDETKIVYALSEQVAFAQFQLEYFLQVFEVLVCVLAVDDDVIQIY